MRHVAISQSPKWNAVSCSHSLLSVPSERKCNRKVAMQRKANKQCSKCECQFFGPRCFCCDSETPLCSLRKGCSVLTQSKRSFYPSERKVASERKDANFRRLRSQSAAPHQFRRESSPTAPRWVWASGAFPRQCTSSWKRSSRVSPLSAVGHRRGTHTRKARVGSPPTNLHWSMCWDSFLLPTSRKWKGNTHDCRWLLRPLSWFPGFALWWFECPRKWTAQSGILTKVAESIGNRSRWPTKFAALWNDLPVTLQSVRWKTCPPQWSGELLWKLFEWKADFSHSQLLLMIPNLKSLLMHMLWLSFVLHFILSIFSCFPCSDCHFSMLFLVHH